MAIAKMLKLKLVGINAKQDQILNALHSTSAVELAKPNQIDGFERVAVDKSDIKNKKERLVQALSIIAEKCKNAKVDGGQADGFGVTYGEFMQIVQKEQDLLDVADKVKDLNDAIAIIRAEITALQSELDYLSPYILMQERFCDFKSTSTTLCKLGTVEKKNLQKAIERFEGVSCLQYSVLGEDERFAVVCVIYHESVVEDADRALVESGFIRCVLNGEFTAKEFRDELYTAIKNKEQKIYNSLAEIISFTSQVANLKILSDYYSFELEKKTASEEFERTKSTFYLEAFVPEDLKQSVEDALQEFDGQIYKEYTELTENDYAPTLMKNNKVASSFEFVTNLYSVPKYIEYDPNIVMGIFFSIFLGFITADAGYGLLMIIAGVLFNLKSKRKTGINKLASVIVMAGIPTVLFGIGFDSWFGLGLLRSLNIIQSPFLPDPVAHTSILAGITIPSLLLIALGMGVVHIMASLLVLAWTHFKKGRILDGICEGVVWAVFLAGLMLLVLCEVGVVQGATNIAIGLLVGGVVLGAIGAGIHAKGFGKFTKAFGAVYGLINYMSDILSYARLYGLMLSGAKIAEIFSQQLAVPMLESPGGVVGVIACAAIMLVGHAFNIAMGLLGAFIHDARLQYVEFVSHFYTGDSELFKPLGSKFEHIYLDM